jgi:3-phenylpropionate/cinnamic acid dioxygenase small subunit
MSSGEQPSPQALAEFVYHEARLLDEKRFDEWYELLTDDVRYWMPLTRGQPDGELFTSLFYEDRLLLKVRLERLRHPNAFSQQQPSFCQHVLQQPSLESADPVANRYVTRTPFLYVEAQLDQQLVLAGVTYHHLTVLEGRLRIHLKKIELVNCDAALPSIQLLL